MRLGDARELLRRLGGLPAREEGLADPEIDLRQEVGNRQESFDPVALRAVGIHHQERRRPLHAEPLELRLLLLDVDLDRKERAGDRVDDLRIGIDLGIQPSTSASLRRGAEVQ